VVEDRVVAEIARHWDEGWNRADVEVIMAPFADDVVFASPFLPRLTGDPSQRTIDGAAALRRYVVDALARASDVRYTLHQALAGTDAVVLVYTPPTRPAGGPEPNWRLSRAHAALRDASSGFDHRQIR
jgi:ketosteroid isomerase-like protein